MIFGILLSIFKNITAWLTISTKEIREKERLKQTACEQVSSNDLILVEIFNKLPLADLNNARLVNTYWNTLVNALIMRKNLWSVSKLFVSSSSAFIENRRYRKELGEFVTCMKSSRKFLFTSITAHLALLDSNILSLYLFFLHDSVEGIQESSAVTALPLNSSSFFFVQFLKLFGREFKSARIHIEYKNLESLICPLILHSLPNLCRLKLTEEDFTPRSYEIFMNNVRSYGTGFPETSSTMTYLSHKLSQRANSPLHFPFLEFLAYDYLQMCPTPTRIGSTPLIVFPRILTSAVNLKKIFQVDVSLLETVLISGKVQKVKECIIDFMYIGELSRALPSMNSVRLEQFANANAQLEIFCFGLKHREISCPRVRDCFAKILHSSKNSLRKLSIPAFRFIPWIVLPNQFPRLVHLDIDNAVCMSEYEPRNFSLLFPHGYLLQEKFPFPCVHHLTLINICKRHDVCKMFFFPVCQEGLTSFIQYIPMFRSLKQFQMHSTPKYDKSADRNGIAMC